MNKNNCNINKINIKRRDSKRLREAGVKKLPMNPNYSALRNQSGRFDQVPVASVGYTD